MKVLMATALTQGHRDNDYNFCENVPDGTVVEYRDDVLTARSECV